MTKLPWDDPRIGGGSPPSAPLPPETPRPPRRLSPEECHANLRFFKAPTEKDIQTAVRTCVLWSGGTQADFEEWARKRERPVYSIEPWFLGEKCAQEIGRKRIAFKEVISTEVMMNKIKECVLSKGGTLKDFEAWKEWKEYSIKKPFPPIPIPPTSQKPQFPWGTILVAALILMLLRRQ